MCNLRETKEIKLNRTKELKSEALSKAMKMRLVVSKLKRKICENNANVKTLINKNETLEFHFHLQITE